MKLPIGSKMEVCGLLLCASLIGCAEDEASITPRDGSAPAPDTGAADGGLRDGGGADAASADASGADAAARDANAGDAGADAGPPLAEGERLQDRRMFTIDPGTLPFDALAGAQETDRWSGVLEGAGYRIEVPKTGWNGVLVMYAHGYGGTTPALRVTNPSIRRYLLENGYAWAASSYSTNYYDVRTGVEDTNKLALAFNQIAESKGRPLPQPTKRIIMGHSMGGHVTGAAIEKEALETAQNKVTYNAALPMCGVMGDVALFEYFAAYQAAAHQLTGIPVPAAGVPYAPVAAQMQALLFTNFPSAMMPVGTTTPLGDRLRTIVMNLTGGERPLFEVGFASTWQGTVWGTFGGDGTINGILADAVVDTTQVKYQLDNEAAISPEEETFNAQVYRSRPEPNANPVRSDGVRWIPAINGEFNIPVISLHTLGDLYVPFKMQQVYLERAKAKGSDGKLVQRAVRGTSHCDFTYREQVDAFEALVKWESEGVKPAGDEILDPAVLRDMDYGCKFTNNAFTPDEMAAAAAAMPTGAAYSRRDVRACPTP
jgi:hypothetical protein